MNLKGTPKRRPATQIEDIIYRRNGRWYNASTDRYLKNATAKRLLSYYQRHPLTVPGYYARGEKKKARRLAHEKMQQDGTDRVDMEMRSPGGKTKVRYNKRKRDDATVSEGEIDRTTDYGRLIDYVVPQLEDRLRTYERIDVTDINDPYELQASLNRHVELDTSRSGSKLKHAKDWTARRTNAIADHLGITLMQVKRKYNYTVREE